MSNRAGVLTSLFLFLSLVGACSPSIDAAAKNDVDHRLSVLKPVGQTYPAPTAFAPRPFTVGQWTEHKMVDEKGNPSLMTYKIVGQQGDAFWVETATASYYGRTVTKMLLFIGDRMNPESVDIRAVKTRDSRGRVNEFDANMLMFTKSMWKSAIGMLFVSWQGQPQETATVPAGSFAGSFKARTDATWGPWRAASMSWSHPAVPLSGLVKSQGIDKPHSIDLIAFGETGATSELP